MSEREEERKSGRDGEEKKRGRERERIDRDAILRVSGAETWKIIQ